MENLIYYVLVNDSCVGNSTSLFGALNIAREANAHVKKRYPPTLRPEIHIKSLNTVTNDWHVVNIEKLKGVNEKW